MTKVIALIPARGGSLRIPRKNLQLVGGRSLLARAITAAAEAEVSPILVSTEDEEIAAAARAAGADVLMRPAALAAADVPMAPVVRHFCAALQLGAEDLVVLLEPPATFRRGRDVAAALRLLQLRPDADAVRTVTRVEHPSYFLHEIGESGFLSPLTPGAYRSAPPILWQDNGVANVIRVGSFLANGLLFDARVLGLEIRDTMRGLDIDDPEDLALAQLMAADLDSVS